MENRKGNMRKLPFLCILFSSSPQLVAWCPPTQMVVFPPISSRTNMTFCSGNVLTNMPRNSALPVLEIFFNPDKVTSKINHQRRILKLWSISIEHLEKKSKMGEERSEI
jgi:hypothetical protein